MNVWGARGFCAWLAGLWIGSAALAAEGAVVTNRPAADTTLWAPDPNNNLGRSDLAAGRTLTFGPTRALLRFDVSTLLPAGARITSAQLVLRVIKVPPGQVTSAFSLHRMLKAWNEGSKIGTRGGAATAGEPTWNMQAAPSTPWSTPGGAAGAEYAAESSGSKVMSLVGSYAFDSTPQAVADVQRWLDRPDENHGWILISESEGTPKSAKRFGSRESAGVSPVLIIEYEPPVEPDLAPVISSVERVGALLRIGFAAKAGNSYELQSAPALPAGPWSRVTEIPAKFESQQAVVEDAIGPGAKFYRLEARVIR